MKGKRGPNRPRKRFIPNAKPGFEGMTVIDALAARAPKPVKPQRDPIPIGDGVTFDGRTVTTTIDPPEVDPAEAVACAVPSALKISTKAADEDLTGLTPKQRNWWRHGSGKHRRIGQVHQRKFIAALAKFPDVTAAAACTGFSLRSWHYLRARDPEFSAAWDAAVKASLPVLERAMMIRGFEGTLEPVTGNGQVIAYKRVYSDRMAELIARKYDPASYSEKLMVAGQVNGTVNHVHHLSPALEALASKVMAIGAPVVDGSVGSADPPDLVAQVMGRVTHAKALDVVDNGSAQRAEPEQDG